MKRIPAIILQAYPAFSRGESPGSAQKARKHWLEKFPPGPGVSVGLFSGPRLPWPLSEARGERAAPEDCRAGHLRASSPSRSAVRHGFLGSRLRRPATDLARLPPGRYPPFPARAGRMKPGHRVVSCGGLPVLRNPRAAPRNPGIPKPRYVGFPGFGVSGFSHSAHPALSTAPLWSPSLRSFTEI